MDDHHSDRGSLDSSRSLTPDQLARTNCSQCYLLRSKIKPDGQSTSSQRSSRSNTPEHHCHHYQHNFERKFDHSPSLLLYRRRDRQTGRMLMIHDQIIEKENQSDIQSEFKDIIQNSFEPRSSEEFTDQDDSIETEIISSDNFDEFTMTKFQSTPIKKFDSSLHQRLAPQEAESTLEQLTIFTSPTRKMSPFLLSKYIFLFYFLECSGLALVWFNRVQPKEFIDEQFHWRQAYAFCQGNFSQWDNKITTPPGLYLISYISLKPFEYLHIIRCESLLMLRFINIVFSFGNFILFYKIFSHNFKDHLDKNGTSSKEILLSSLALIHLPPLFMFNFLYYTDTGSIFFIMLAYYLHIVQSNHWYPSIFGFISLWFRQTNIVWIFFFAFLHAINIFGESYYKYYEYKKSQFDFGPIRLRFRFYQHNLMNPYYLVCFLLDWILSVCRQTIGYILNGVAFLIFIFLNKGIVLGDRNAHQIALHLAQIPYFLTFVFLFSWPLILTRRNINSILRQLILNPAWFLLSTVLLANCLSSIFLYQHPYLLADNRHYVFYLWRRFWCREDWPWFRFLPLPLYVLTLISMWNLVHFRSVDPFQNFDDHRKFIQRYSESFRKIIFFLLITLVIVPHSLIEFRYFLIPYIFWRLNVSICSDSDQLQQNKSSIQIIIELFWSLFINLLTFTIFHFKTFKDSNGYTQRIIW